MLPERTSDPTSLPEHQPEISQKVSSVRSDVSGVSPTLTKVSSMLSRILSVGSGVLSIPSVVQVKYRLHLGYRRNVRLRECRRYLRNVGHPLYGVCDIPGSARKRRSYLRTAGNTSERVADTLRHFRPLPEE